MILVMTMVMSVVVAMMTMLMVMSMFVFAFVRVADLHLTTAQSAAAFFAHKSLQFHVGDIHFAPAPQVAAQVVAAGAFT